MRWDRLALLLLAPLLLGVKVIGGGGVSGGGAGGGGGTRMYEWSSFITAAGAVQGVVGNCFENSQVNTGSLYWLCNEDGAVAQSRSNSFNAALPPGKTCTVDSWGFYNSVGSVGDDGDFFTFTLQTTHQTNDNVINVTTIDSITCYNSNETTNTPTLDGEWCENASAGIVIPAIDRFIRVKATDALVLATAPQLRGRWYAEVSCI